jgi:hypothetical protein
MLVYVDLIDTVVAGTFAAARQSRRDDAWQW